MDAVTLRTIDVFVAGKAPAVTYNPRDDRHLEREVNAYLGQSGKALTVSGPTKSGKTVLVSRILPDHSAIWINGSDMASVDDLWKRIIDWLGLYDMMEVQQQSAVVDGSEVGFQLGIPKIASVSSGFSEGQTATLGSKAGRVRRVSDVAREGLSTLPVPIVIDDFHYVPNGLKQELTRAIKVLVTITHVIMIAVPHEAFEAVRAEPDMNGRIWHLQIEPWTRDELAYIAKKGFEALNVVDGEGAVGSELAVNSQGAPFLMQQLCLDYLLDIGLIGTQPKPYKLKSPASWPEFYKRLANRMTPGVFNALRAGPNTRGQERIDRVLKSGQKTDIYGAVLYGISKLGAETAIPYRRLVRKLEELLIEAPKSQHVTSALGHMATIAQDARASGDAALDYKDDTLHILDPFLSFYLRFGAWDLPKPPTREI